VGFSAAPWLLAGIFIAGGVLALIYIMVRKLRGKSRREAGRIPYGIAIAAGALWVLGVQYTSPRPNPNFRPLPEIKGVHLPQR
jgi:Flp pilus assembly protein protease CpaA